MANKATPGSGDGLTRRERQIMEIVHSQGSASARTIHEQLPDPPTYATVRTILRVLLDKGHLRYQRQGKSYIYHPTTDKEVEGRSTLQRVVQSFFAGSVEQAMSCLIDPEENPLDDAELDRLADLIDKARQDKTKKPNK